MVRKKPRPATEKQKQYARNVGFNISDEITFDEISEILDGFEAIIDFIYRAEQTINYHRIARMKDDAPDDYRRIQDRNHLARDFYNDAKIRDRILDYCEKPTPQTIERTDIFKELKNIFRERMGLKPVHIRSKTGTKSGGEEAGCLLFLLAWIPSLFGL